MKGWRRAASLARLDYPDYELIVVARSAEDLPQGCVPATARVVLAGDGKGGEWREDQQSAGCGEGSAGIERGLGVRRFRWSRAEGVAEGVDRGAVRRWRRGGDGLPGGICLLRRWDAWSLLRSVWNAVIAGGMGAGGNRFVWGGATAIRTKTFHDLNVPAWWRGAISDVTDCQEAVRHAGLRIGFAPGALVASTDHRRHGVLGVDPAADDDHTRFYAPGLWKLALVAHVVYCAAMAGALWLALQGSVLAGAATGRAVGCGVLEGVPAHSTGAIGDDHREWFRRFGWLHVVLVPVGTWLWLYACAAAGWSRVIVWRGYRIVLRTLSAPVARTRAFRSEPDVLFAGSLLLPIALHPGFPTLARRRIATAEGETGDLHKGSRASASCPPE